MNTSLDQIRVIQADLSRIVSMMGLLVGLWAWVPKGHQHQD